MKNKSRFAKLMVFMLSLTLLTSNASTLDSLSPPLFSTQKSESIAYLLALGGTVIPLGIGIPLAENKIQVPTDVALILFGGFIGPSLGQFYSDSWGNGSRGVLIRGVGAFVFLIGAGEVASSNSGNRSCGADPYGEDVCPHHSASAWQAVEIMGATVAAGGVIYSFIDTYFSVQRHNHSTQPKIGLSPTLENESNGNFLPGMLVYYKF